jgi:hypothetical protein
MNQKIEVCTFFDCTATDIRSHKRSSDMSQEDWNYKRNQQRNWETLIQVISLRCQPLNISGPYIFTHEPSGHLTWNFSFETDRQDIFLKDNNPVGWLLDDCSGVPMLLGLGETNKDLFFTPYLVTNGDMPNIIFQIK